MRLDYQLGMMIGLVSNLNREILTNGGERYSMPTLFARRALFIKSLAKLYRSILKLSVGPFVSLITLNDGATGVRVKASKCVTPMAGARTKKSFSLFFFRSYIPTNPLASYFPRHAPKRPQ